MPNPEQRGLRQQTLAQDMGAAQGWISELERGKQPRLEAETVYRFAQALRCSTDSLMPRSVSLRSYSASSMPHG